MIGDSHAHLVRRLEAFAGSLGFPVAYESVPGSAGGFGDRAARRIVVDAGAPPNARLRILVHAHRVHAMGVGYAEYGRARAEVIADAAAHFACASMGLDVAGESIPYVAGGERRVRSRRSPTLPGRSTTSRAASRRRSPSSRSRSRRETGDHSAQSG